MNSDQDNIEREEHIAIMAEGCKISQPEAEELFKSLEAALEDKSNHTS